MAKPSIALQRLAQQRLSPHDFKTPDEVVKWLVAVQAQDYPGAKWSLGLRMQNATDEAIEQAFTDGTILRTHIMRPTWHFVTPADIRWMEELTAPRVKALLAQADRQHEIDQALLSSSYAVFISVLQGGRHLTRTELGAALAGAGIIATGQRLGFIVSHAELDALLCSGPRRGKQFTYALLDERAPQAGVLSRDEALAELTRRYFTGHGPATVHDFAWWSGLTVTDGKAGLSMVASQLGREVVDGKTYWSTASMPPISEPPPTAFLLPTYDEFLIGYTAFDRSRRAGPGASEDPGFTSTIVIGGRVAGSWKRTFKRGVVIIALAPFAPLTAAEREAVFLAARRYGEFLGMSVEL